MNSYKSRKFFYNECSGSDPSSFREEKNSENLLIGGKLWISSNSRKSEKSARTERME